VSIEPRATSTSRVKRGAQTARPAAVIYSRANANQPRQPGPPREERRTAAVDHIRHLFHQTMEADVREAVERLTGRRVLAFISGNHIDPDIAAELFILDAPL
jgi:hypothetical protein